MALKQQLVMVEVECSLLQNLMFNIHRGDQGMASNSRTLVNSSRERIKKEESMHQIDQYME